MVRLLSSREHQRLVRWGSPLSLSACGVGEVDGAGDLNDASLRGDVEGYVARSGVTSVEGVRRKRQVWLKVAVDVGAVDLAVRFLIVVLQVAEVVLTAYARDRKLRDGEEPVFRCFRGRATAVHGVGDAPQRDVGAEAKHRIREADGRPQGAYENARGWRGGRGWKGRRKCRGWLERLSVVSWCARRRVIDLSSAAGGPEREG